MSEIISSEQRHNEIVHLLTQQGRVTVTEIVDCFSISEATARRDLEALAEKGRIQRVRGGALPVTQAPPELPILQREQDQAYAKKMIGQAAASLIQEGEAILLGSGSTVLEVARHLQQRQNLTVITNSLPVMNTLANVAGITIVSLGGVLRPTELSFIGHITEQSLSEVRVDKVFLGVHAISLEQGLTSDFLPEIMTDRTLLKAGREVIVVADHTKVNTVSTAYLTPINTMNTFVTDPGAPAEFVKGLEKLGIRVLIAG